MKFVYIIYKISIPVTEETQFPLRRQKFTVVKVIILGLLFFFWLVQDLVFILL
jgi:hypothetical protein